MGSQWYAALRGGVQGPMASKELVLLAKSGRLQLSDLVWKEGMSEWVPARKIKGLFAKETPAQSSHVRVLPPPLPRGKTPPNPERNVTAPLPPQKPIAPPVPVAIDSEHKDPESPNGDGEFTFDDEQEPTRTTTGTVKSQRAKRVRTIGLITASGLLLSCCLCAGFGAWVTRSQVADENVGMGLSEARVLGEGTKHSRFEEMVREILDLQVVKEVSRPDRSVYKIGSTTVEIRGPRNNLTGIYIRAPAASFKEAQNVLCHMSAIMYFESTVLNPEREVGKLDYLQKWFREELEKREERGSTTFRAEKVVDRFVIVLTIGDGSWETQIRPRK